MPSANRRLDQMKSHHNDHPLSSTSNISLKQLYIMGGLHNPVIDTSISQDTLRTLRDWHNIPLSSTTRHAQVSVVNNVSISESQ